MLSRSPWCPRGPGRGSGQGGGVTRWWGPFPHPVPTPAQTPTALPAPLPESRARRLWQSPAHQLRGEGRSGPGTGARGAGRSPRVQGELPSAPCVSGYRCLCVIEGERKEAQSCVATRSGSQSQREQDVEPRARCAPRPPGFGQARCSEAGQGRPHSPLVFTFPFPSPAWPVGSSGHSRPFSLQSQPPELLVPSASDVSLPDTFWSRRCPGRLGRAAPPSPTVPATPGRAPAGPAQFLPCVSAAGSPWAAPRRASWSQADCSRPRTAACFRRAGPWRGRRGAAPLVGGSAAVGAQVCGAQVCAGLFFSFLPRGFPLLRACARATWACSVTAAKRGRSAPPSLGPFLSPASLRRHACVCACAGVRARVDVRARVPIVHPCLMTRGPVLACAHVCLRVIACRHRAHTCRCASHADTLHAPPSGACVYTNMCTRCRHACTRVSRCVYTWHMAYSNPCAMHVHTRVCVCLGLVVYVDTCVRATVHPHVGGVTTHVNTHVMMRVPAWGCASCAGASRRAWPAWGRAPGACLVFPEWPVPAMPAPAGVVPLASTRRGSAARLVSRSSGAAGSQPVLSICSVTLPRLRPRPSGHLAWACLLRPRLRPLWVVISVQRGSRVLDQWKRGPGLISQPPRLVSATRLPPTDFSGS